MFTQYLNHLFFVFICIRVIFNSQCHFFRFAIKRALLQFSRTRSACTIYLCTIQYTFYNVVLFLNAAFYVCLPLRDCSILVSWVFTFTLSVNIALWKTCISAIKTRITNWQEYLFKRLSGAKTFSADFLQKVCEHFPNLQTDNGNSQIQVLCVLTIASSSFSDLNQCSWRVQVLRIPTVRVLNKWERLWFLSINVHCW